MTSAGYAAPLSLSDAVALLCGEPVRPRARRAATACSSGRRGRRSPPRCSWISGRSPGLSSIEPAGGGLKIGAMTTLRAVAASDAVRRNYPSLARPVLTGDAQTRNRATVGGSLAGANSGDTDLAAILIALGASLDVTSPAGSRTVAVEDYLGQRPRVTRSSRRSHCRSPAANTAVAYETQRHPATLTPLVGVAACVTRGANGSISAVRIGLVGATVRAARLSNVEQALQGQPASDAVVKAAAAAAGQGLTVRGDLFGSAAYRSHLVRVLTARAVAHAAKAIAG